MAGKRRAVIICHPDFDQAGAMGVKEAKAFAEQLIVGQKQMIEMARQGGEDPVNIVQVENHTRAYQIVIRSIDEDIL